MSEKIKDGKCTCGCVEQQVRKTNYGTVFTRIGGIGYIQWDEEAPFCLRVFDEYFEEDESFHGETPIDYAVKRSWQHFHMCDDEMPEETFKGTIINILKVFKDVV